MPTLQIEKSLWNSGYKLIAGIDEVGRGCFAGSVVAGAVIFPPTVKLPKGIADSKLLKPKLREELSLIIQDLSLFWAVGEASVEEINKVGIGKATQIAFKRAVKALSSSPDFLLIDAFYIDEFAKQVQRPVKNGDKICASISAASIIAKVYRDGLMRGLSKKYPEYGFFENKGYGTKFHREAIKKHGLSRIHRTSFDLGKFL
ncbi:ribonuclease HII [Candidatus Daviesbacteria bacterium RIFCSPHIGHO2_01_FULL_36_37]|uniref:Ribonuclease HII n=2 Tax=Candidatus Daviesiibacteriota TaxID=1752718 RepID=A0A1F5K700_9BACT|nr:MAG: ribonuclease HII [Candidatus Daviesbacteria bacterium RIFCSPHIGHO2_01_FULL_36_37]OGE36614.1 MAG: ribonuclease HII [Candidatus Daviesbacteria bacterium RIFCSPHIGHO2_12_FULL_37_16]